MIFFFLSLVWANFYIGVETGSVLSNYNHFSIPKDTGTDISVSGQNFSFPGYARVFGAIEFIPNHEITFLFAPLFVQYQFKSSASFLFDNQIFNADQDTTVDYRFNSYRIGYRYRLIDLAYFYLKVGATAKIRDAYIAAGNSQIYKKFSNIGFVPLLSLSTALLLTRSFHLFFDIEGLAAGPGYAVDLAGGFRTIFNSDTLNNLNFAFATGYRRLEGGANVSTVKNFAAFSYFFISLQVGY